MQCPRCHATNPADRLKCIKCGSSLQETRETLSYPANKKPRTDTDIYFSPGDIFADRYQIIEEIGRGGMGRVYKAEDKELGITVALKMIRPEYASSSRFIERFKKETVLARSISHENVVRIFDLGEAENIKYISMEYIKGQNLKELIRASGSLTIETAIKIAGQIGEALKVAHRKGIIHRDLKPHNVMIDKDGKVYAMDFGLAKSVEGQETSLAGTIIGTPEYLSPEQALGEKIDQSSDIYALGLIIYEMLTGKQPFEAETATGYIQKHILERPLSPSKINPQIPSYLERIVLKCLEKDRKHRYKNAEEFLGDLEKQKVKSRPLISRLSVNKVLKGVYVVPLILLVAISLYLWKGRGRETIPTPFEGARKSIAVMTFENNTGDSGLNHWRRALQDLMITDLTQSLYFRVLPVETDRYSFETLDKIALEENIQYFILGSFAKAGENFKINVKIQEARSHELMGTTTQDVKAEKDFYSMVDNLTVWIKSQFNFTSAEIAADIDREIGKITTNSLKALNYYAEGKKHYNERNFPESIGALEKAVAIDPGFAMAYEKLAKAHGYIKNPDQAREYLQKALSLLHHVSDRERLRIQGYVSFTLDRSTQKAFENYQKLLKLYPEDEEGNLRMGSLYRIMEEWDLALEHFEKSLSTENKSELAIILENIAVIYMAKGLYEKAEEILQINQYAFSNQSFFHRLMGIVLICQGKYEPALQEVKRALSLEPDNYYNTRLLGNIHHIKGDFLEAEKAYRKLSELEDPQPRLDSRFWMGHLYLLLGKMEECKNEINEGISKSQESAIQFEEITFLLFSAHLNLQQENFEEALDVSNRTLEVAKETGSLSDQRLALHYLGLLYLEIGKMNEAKITAEKLRKLVEQTGNLKYMRDYYHLRGTMARNIGQISDQIKDYEKAISLLPDQQYIFDEHAFYFEALASAYHEADDIEKAQKYYEKVASLTMGRLQWGDIYAKSFYKLGKIYQKKMDKKKAIENYEKFLKLWNDADSNLSEIAEAKKQLRELQKASNSNNHY